MKPARILLSLCLFIGLSAAAAAENPFLGRWALTIPGGRAGWLGVEEKDGALSSSVLWGGGSVVPTVATKLDGDTLIVTRESRIKKKGKDGKVFGRDELSGQRIPDLPAAPNLSEVKYGEPVNLLSGSDLSGWRLVNPESDNGWSVKDGVLMNRVEKGKHFGNLRTDAEFEDFNLRLDVRTVEGSNSGVYLRGIYEVQVMESFGKPVDSHHMGALYSRITPSVAAEKPIGEWQTLDITLVDRHLTVILNGTTIIDNQPVLGCTGGALTSDESKPGPILLQGDHTDVDYRNIVLRPVVK